MQTVSEPKSASKMLFDGVMLFFWRLLVGLRPAIWKESIHSWRFWKRMFKSPIMTIMEYFGQGVVGIPDSVNPLLIYNYEGVLNGVASKDISLIKKVTLDTNINYGKFPMLILRAALDFGYAALDTGGDKPEMEHPNMGGIRVFRRFIKDMGDKVQDKPISAFYSFRRRFSMVAVLAFPVIFIAAPIVALVMDGAGIVAAFYLLIVVGSLVAQSLSIDDDIRRFIDRLPTWMKVLLVIIISVVVPVLAYFTVVQTVAILWLIRLMLAYVLAVIVFAK